MSANLLTQFKREKMVATATIFHFWGKELTMISLHPSLVILDSRGEFQFSDLDQAA